MTPGFLRMALTSWASQCRPLAAPQWTGSPAGWPSFPPTPMSYTSSTADSHYHYPGEAITLVKAVHEAGYQWLLSVKP